MTERNAPLRHWRRDLLRAGRHRPLSRADRERANCQSVGDRAKNDPSTSRKCIAPRRGAALLVVRGKSKETQMGKLFSVALIAAAMLANPAMAAWHDKTGAVVQPSRVVHCVRAPDAGQFAGGSWSKPPCEPATRVSGAWHDRNGAVIPASNVVHCIRAPDAGQFAGGSWNQPPCEPASWR
jgi:hypothetical protein